MVYDSTVDDTEESHTASRLRTDGGGAEAAADETQESTDEGEQTQQESTDESDTEDEAQQETADESEQAQQESTDEGETEDEAQQETADEGDDQDAADEPATIEADDEAVAEQTGDAGVEPQPADDSADESTESDDSEQSSPSLDGEGDTASIIEIRNQVIELSTDVIGRGLDGIIEVTRNDDSWRAVVEIIERRSVPDTQDILGQYEIELDERGEVIGYRRLEKYRRSDTGPNEH